RFEPYTEKQVAQIVQLNYPQWAYEACKQMVRWFGKVPRVVLGFARRVQRRANIFQGNILVAIQDVVKDEKIDYWGMRIQQVAILKALYQRPGMLLRHLMPICQTTSSKEV